MKYQGLIIRLLTLFLCLLSIPAFSSVKVNNPHYNSKGFFDIHVCNWPEQPLFLMAVFSTLHYKDIKQIEVFSPEQRSVGVFNLNKFRVFKNKKKQTKKAFITKFSLPKSTSDGWYSARITLNDNSTLMAKDYVMHKKLPIADNPYPQNQAEDIAAPETLHWQAIKGAGFYQVFIKDTWQDNKLIYKSKLLKQNQLTLPANLLQAGGLYSWRIHARDINEDIKLGDFNHGSLSDRLSFSIKD
ncbi:MAG: hypothetical protein OEY36_04735 [Gammaproteobacteria bacterium]|nr:hypothetical protein [Gammaproteobacteria bacterium]